MDCQNQVERSIASLTQQPIPSSSQCNSNNHSPTVHDNSNVSLPQPETVAATLIARDINILKTKIRQLQTQVNKLEKFSNSGLVKQEIQQMKAMMSDLSTKATRTSSSSMQITSILHDHKSIQVNLSSPTPPPSSFTIASWNCRDIKSGLPYVVSLADNHDVIVLNEHWLWPFEIHKFLNLHPDMSGFAIADQKNSRLRAICREDVVVLGSCGSRISRLYLPVLGVV